MEFVTPVNVCLSSAGVILNLVNVRVFLRQDWTTNNVTLTLLFLSFTDLLILVTSLIFDLFSIFQITITSSVFDFTAVQYYIVAWTLAMFSDISSLTTLLVSLERCLCIITPLHVQSLFSVSRTKVALASIWTVVALGYGILFSSSRLVWTDDSILNTTRLTIGLSMDRMKIEMAHNITNTIILPTFCEISVLLNTVVMVIGLKRSSSFQKKSRCLNSTSGHGSEYSQRVVTTPSTKYNRLVIVISFISGIFIACNTPTVIIVYCKQFVPGFSFSGAYRKSYIASMYGIFFLYAFNASINFFVYVSLNQKYRNNLRDIFGWQRSG